MKIKLILFALFICCINKVDAQPILSISGSALSGFSSYDQGAKAKKERQFESEANIVLSADLSERAVTNIELGLGLSDRSGFTNGVGVAAYDFTYQTDYYNTAVSLGSLTVPFGQFAGSQTYNSSVNSPFVYNDLGYTLLTGNNSLVDFGSVGFLTSSELEYGLFKSFIFNGTAANSNNEDEGFGIALHYQTKSLVNATFNGEPVNFTLGFSYLNSNDYGNADGIDAETTAGIIDTKVDLNSIEFGGYISILNFNDFNSSTEDEVRTSMMYIARDFGNVQVAARYSIITPVDYNGDGAGVSSALGIYGLTDPNVSMPPPTDIETTRYQASATITFEENFKLRNEIVYDKYPNEIYDTAAVLSYASLTF